MMYGLLALVLYLYTMTEWKYRNVVALVVLGIWLVRIFNPIGVNYKVYKAYKQSIFGGGPTKDTNEDIETFDNP